MCRGRRKAIVADNWARDDPGPLFVFGFPVTDLEAAAPDNVQDIDGQILEVGSRRKRQVIDQSRVSQFVRLGKAHKLLIGLGENEIRHCRAGWGALWKSAV